MRTAEPLATFRRPPEGSCGGLGVRERSDSPATATERLRDPGGGHDDCEDRLPRVGLGHDTVDRDGDVVGGSGHGWHEQDDERVEVRIAEHRGERLPVRVGRGAAQHVDGIREARLGREERCELRARLLGRLGELEPHGVAYVGAQDPQPPGVGEEADAPALRLGLARKQGADVDQLLERGGPDHTGLVEEGVDGCFGAGERGRVRARGALPRQGRPALQRQDRLPSRDPPGQPPEPARVAEGLEVEQHDVCVRIVLPPLEQVVRRHVGLVPDRDERRETQPTRLGRLEKRNSEGAAL